MIENNYSTKSSITLPILQWKRMKYKFKHLFLHLIQEIVRLLLLAKIKNKILLFCSVACILSLRANTFKRGRATKPSTSCPELGRNWMKHEDALFSLFSIYDVHNMGVKVIPLTGS